MILAVALRFLADHNLGTKDGPLHLAGERYNFPEQHAAEHIAAGRAELVDVVHTGVVDAEHPLPADEIDALRARMRAVSIAAERHATEVIAAVDVATVVTTPLDDEPESDLDPNG